MFAIDAASNVPPFEQLRGHLAGQIRTRELPVGSRLPTVRQLAADLGLAVNTVARTYRELETAGLVETRGRGGTFVAAGGDTARDRARAAATDYAALTTSLGLPRAESLAIIAAALDAAPFAQRS